MMGSVHTPSSMPLSAGRIQDLSPVLLAALEQTRSSACITTADLDHPGPTIVYVNPAYCAMTGRSRDEVIGSSPRAMLCP
jgi:PAS domain S-box-containing protein